MITNKIIKKHINFDYDLEKFSNSLFDNINDTNILVIGGAGTIGSSYIKQILKFKPSKITPSAFSPLRIIAGPWTNDFI